MSGAVETIVIGGGTSGLAAAIALAKTGGRVVVCEAAPAMGGVCRAIEFAPGFRAEPLGGDPGWMPPEVARGLGLGDLPQRASSGAMAADGAGGWLEFSPDPAVTAASLHRYSPKDADRWPEFAGRVHRLAGILRLLYVSPAPRIDADRLAELVSLLKVGRKLRGLGREEMIELLRIVPMPVADVLDEWFETDGLKGALAADALVDLSQGPMSGGTAFNLLHRQVGSPAGLIRARPTLEGRKVVERLVDRARAAGVELRNGAPVQRVLVRDGRVAGVELASGEELAGREVISSLDPRRSLRDLVDPVHFDPDFLRAVGNVRFRGSTSILLLGLDGLPDLPGRGAGTFTVAPSVRFLERAYDAVKYGRSSEEPALELSFPSVSTAGLAPEGKQVAVVRIQHTPYQLRGADWSTERERIAERAMAGLERVIPGLSARVIDRAVLAPPDLEREFGLTEGAASHGEMMLDQILFMRPVAGWSRYAMPLSGYYLCGSGTHPGGGMVGASGWLAAQAVLLARGK